MSDRTQIIKLVEEKIAGSEQFLVEVKMTPGKITVLIDKPTGITIEECIRLNRYLTQQLEPTGVTESHELEVSSPGMDQPLKVFNQYLRRIGREVQVTTLDGRQHMGTLMAATPDGIDLVKSNSVKQNKKKEITEQQMHFPFQDIKETKLILTFKN